MSSHGAAIKVLLKALIDVDKNLQGDTPVSEFVAVVKRFGAESLELKNKLGTSSHPHWADRLNAACVACIKASQGVKTDRTNAAFVRAWNEAREAFVATVKELIAAPVTYNVSAVSKLDSMSLGALPPPEFLPPAPGTPEAVRRQRMEDRKKERETAEQQRLLEERRRRARENADRRMAERQKREEEERLKQMRRDEEERLERVRRDNEDKERRHREAERRKEGERQRVEQLRREEAERRERVRKERERTERLFAEALLPPPMDLPPPPSSPAAEAAAKRDEERAIEAADCRKVEAEATRVSDDFWDLQRATKSGLVGLSARLMALGPPKRTLQECKGQLKALAEIESTKRVHVEALPQLKALLMELNAFSFSGKYHTFQYSLADEARRACTALSRSQESIDDEFEAKRILVAAAIKRLRSKEQEEKQKDEAQREREQKEHERREADRLALEEKYRQSKEEEARREAAIERDRERGAAVIERARDKTLAGGRRVKESERQGQGLAEEKAAREKREEAARLEREKKQREERERKEMLRREREAREKAETERREGEERERVRKEDEERRRIEQAEGQRKALEEAERGRKAEEERNRKKTEAMQKADADRRRAEEVRKEEERKRVEAAWKAAEQREEEAAKKRLEAAQLEKLREENLRKEQEEKEKREREAKQRKEREEKERFVREARQKKERQEQEEKRTRAERERKEREELERAERQRKQMEERVLRARVENEKQRREELERKAIEANHAKEREERERREKQSNQIEGSERRGREEDPGAIIHGRGEGGHDGREKGHTVSVPRIGQASSAYAGTRAPSVTVTRGSVDAPMSSKTVPGGTRGVGSRWASMMANKEAEEHEKARQVIRNRREKGAKHVDEQLTKLIAEMKRVSATHGSPVPAGKAGICAVKYGVLFANTMGTMSELSATLNTAKKRNVVSYEGFMLRQGFDDETVVMLISESFKKTKVTHSKIVPRQPSASAPSIAIAKCDACGKTAYVTERLVVNGKTFHKRCFKCSMCKSILKLSAYSFVNDTYYCKPCFMRGHSSGEIKFT